ncbi:MAG TPA: PAS domain-containing protein [Chloroflexaceae bacterium]|nr:PAS domain-containing protein [Chloroflexaceae bacterium]
MIAVDWHSVLPPWLGEALPIGVMMCDTALRVRYWGPWLAAQSGLSAEQVAGRPLGELFPDLAARGLERYFARALGGATVPVRQRDHGYLLPLPAPPNNVGLAHMQQRATIAPLVVEGQVVGALTVITDMTERVTQDLLLRQTIEQQDETLALLDTLITKAPIGFAFVDTELRYRGINERLAAINGLSVEEHLGRTLWDVVPNLADQQIPHLLEVIETGEPLINAEVTGETQARPGLPRVWQVSYYPVHTSSMRRLGVGVLVTEITEQRRAEERERFTSELSEALTASLDYQATLDALVQTVVPFLADWAVIHTMGDRGGAPFTSVAHADPQKAELARRVQALLPALLGPGGPVGPVLRDGRARLAAGIGDAELAASAPDPESLELMRALEPRSALLVPLSVGGVAIGVLSLARCGSGAPYTTDDLTLAEEVGRRAIVALENARLFAAAERSRAMAEEAVQLRDAFFSIAAHELRTPLTTLLGRAQLLQKWLAQDDGADQRTQRSMRIVVEQSQRLNRMITALLDVSRIQAGRFSIEPALMDLGALVRRVVEETRTTLTSHTLVLQEAGAPLLMRGDEVRLEQVLQNLLSNAIKYSPAGGEVRVTVGAAGGEAAVTVRDNGIGIPAASQGQLFRRFYRAANAERQGISGLGIGLFVVNEIVELHGGRIGVTSAEGDGSTFVVRLPLAVEGA